MVLALKITTATLLLLVALLVIVISCSGKASAYKCTGKLAEGDESMELHILVTEYRWWVGLWSDSDGAVYLELPNAMVQYYSKVEEVGPQLQIRDGDDLSGNFSTLSKTLAIKTYVGFFDGSCVASV